MEKKIFHGWDVAINDWCINGGDKQGAEEMVKFLMKKYKILPRTDINRKKAVKLKASGMTVRGIMKQLGYKNPGSVTHLLTAK